MDRESRTPKTIPYRAAPTYIARIWEYPPPPGSVPGTCVNPQDTKMDTKNSVFYR